MKVAGEAEVDVGEVDEDGDGGAVAADGAHEAAVAGVDARDVAEDLGDAHDGDVFGADDAVEAGGAISPPPRPKSWVGMAGAECGDELRAVVVAGGFAGREEDARIVTVGDEISVNFSEEIACKKMPPGDSEQWSNLW